jgi:hypothetical protein
MGSASQSKLIAYSAKPFSIERKIFNSKKYEIFNVDRLEKKIRQLLYLNLTNTFSELPNVESEITTSASYPETSIVVDFFRPLLLCLTV